MGAERVGEDKTREDGGQSVVAFAAGWFVGAAAAVTVLAGSAGLGANAKAFGVMAGVAASTAAVSSALRKSTERERAVAVDTAPSVPGPASETSSTPSVSPLARASDAVSATAREAAKAVAASVKAQKAEKADADAEIEAQAEDDDNTDAKSDSPRSIRVAFGTTTGKAETFSSMVEDMLRGKAGAADEVDRVDLSTYDQDNLEQEDVVVFVVSTWTGGQPPEKCRVFFDWLEDMAADFRVDKSRFLSSVRFAVIGLGNADYDEDFCGAAVRLDELLAALGGQRLAPVSKLDDAIDLKPQVAGSATDVLVGLGFATGVQGAWRETLEAKLAKAAAPSAQTQRSSKASNTLPSAEADESGGVDVEEEEDRINDMYLQQADAEEELADMEDMIVVGASSGGDGEPREMVTPSQRKALTKEGYKIIGTHSAVKLCRWTKHHLRGRGGCYKHTFYGITSYQCMEATPSLACANKCTFCWRHHKNPVGKEWRWKEDAPDMIVEQAVELHREMIKQMRGVPGVQPDRYKEAFTVRHCALSLVGEPIMYPQINALVGELHAREISTFLVTNAQFPQAIKDLDPVTQLYVSVDAASKEALREVDRPLFKDFWERFTGSLEAIRDKGQRTVYRLTLVKQWNMMEEELEGYARLVELGQPDLIEIKAVTFCGKSDGSNLTMQNVPWHHEVRKFAEALCSRLNGEYGTACEHVHSCCTLLARKETYLRDGRWWTWIDYDRFHELVRDFHASGGAKTFTSKDYIAETPDWATWGADEEGFDPTETRFRRARAPKTSERPPAGLPRTAQAAKADAQAVAQSEG